MAGSGVTNINRSFTVPPGPYDVIIVVKEPPSKQKNARAPKTALIHQDVEIPDLWNGEFTTSTVMIAKAHRAACGAADAAAAGRPALRAWAPWRLCRH